MDALGPERELRVLAADGLRALPPLLLPDLAEALWESAEQSGDARRFVLARTMETLAVWWDECDDEANQGLPSPLVDQLDEVLAARLSDVIRADPPQGLVLARELRANVLVVLKQWNGWQRWYPELGAR